PSLEHISFVCAGGAEANEKALRIARLHAPRNNDGSVGKRVLAFECGFHGRTFASLMATWNPAKRGPFELSGYQAIFCKPNLADVKEVLAHQGSQIYAILIE